MSNLSAVAEQECVVERNCEALELIIHPKKKDLGGLTVRRALPTRERKMVGPWIFFDHMGPATFPENTGIDVRPHPHINIATVTYLFEGEILHRDSLGSFQTITPGDINLMVTGSGMTHSERERPAVRSVEHQLHGLQLWLVLPEEYEEMEPEFHHYPSSQIPTTVIQGVSVRVMMGTAYGHTSPVKTFAETLYVEAQLHPGQKLTLPNAQERALYVAEGCVKARSSQLEESTLAVFEAGTEVTIEASRESRIALIGGEKMGARFIEWNFVSSRKERIEQAKKDWQEGRFAKVGGDEKEFIPLPKRSVPGS